MGLRIPGKEKHLGTLGGHLSESACLQCGLGLDVGIQAQLSAFHLQPGTLDLVEGAKGTVSRNNLEPSEVLLAKSGSYL